MREEWLSHSFVSDYFFLNASRLNVDEQMIKNVNAQQAQCIFLTLSIWNCVDELTSHVNSSMSTRVSSEFSSVFFEVK